MALAVRLNVTNNSRVYNCIYFDLYFFYFNLSLKSNFQLAWKRSLKCKAGTNCLNIKDTNKRTILFPRNRKLKLVKSLMALVFDAT